MSEKPDILTNEPERVTELPVAEEFLANLFRLHPAGEPIVSVDPDHHEWLSFEWTRGERRVAVRLTLAVRYPDLNYIVVDSGNDISMLPATVDNMMAALSAMMENK